MTALIGQARQWWDGRSLRERRMLAVMFALVAATTLWLGVVRPVFDWRTAAAEDRARAEAEHGAVVAALVRLAPANDTTAPADARGLEPTVRQTAEAAGLTISTGMDASGRLGFRIDRGSTAAVFGWLATLKTAHGLDPVSLGVIENADATLQVEGGF